MYRNIYYNGKENTITLFTWDTDGKRIKAEVSAEPYLYLEGPGESESIFGSKLVKKRFRNQFDRYKFLKDSHITRVFENLPITQQYLVDTFWKQNETPEFSAHPIRVVFLDIEVYSPGEFVAASEASAPINVITVYDSLIDKFVTWTYKKFENKSDDVIVHFCLDENEMLEKFISWLQLDYPDILSGWNSEGYDIPYIVNRVRKLLGDDWVNKLSPAGRVYSRDIRGQFGQMEVRWYFEGLSLIDYLDVYKRFSTGQKESYKLDAIAEAELGENKISYGNMNLAELADSDWQKFMEYNIQDVRLLKGLENKLKFLELVRMLAYIGLVTFEGALGAVAITNGAAAIRARYRNQKLPTFVRGEDNGSINPGAFVADPKAGFHENVVSFDANSLYPSVMVSLNMSPETKIGKIESKTDTDITIRHVNGKCFTLALDKYALFLDKEKVSTSKANVLFSQKKKGIIPEILDYYYAKRVEVRAKLKKLKKAWSEMEEGEQKKKVKMIVDQLDAKQLAIKIYINSVYGYFGNKHAQMGDDDIASSVTLTGQETIKQSNILFKEFVRKFNSIITEEDLEQCIIYNDTDSGYFSLAPLTAAGLKFIDKGKVSKEAHAKIQELEEFLNTEIVKWGEKELNSKDCRFKFKREVIADTGIFLAKKRYILHILDEEGIACNKFKYVGVEVVRSTMPKTIKPYVKKIVETMLTSKNQTETNKALNETYEIFKKLPPESIVFVSGLNNLDKHTRACTGFNTAKRMPRHAKAAYFHNIVLDRLDLGGKYEKIKSGDKVRYFDIKLPNVYNIRCIGFKYYLPVEFLKVLEIDYDSMFKRHIFAAIERLYENVGWRIQEPGNLCQTNLLELLG